MGPTTHCDPRTAQLVEMLERHALEHPGLADSLLVRVQLIRLSSESVH